MEQRSALTQSTSTLNQAQAQGAVGGDMDHLESTRAHDNDDGVQDSDDQIEMEPGVLSLPCPQCGKPFGPGTGEIKGMVPPQQLVPCGCTICAHCIQSWEDTCKDKEAPVACPVCDVFIRDIAPNQLYGAMVMQLMRIELLEQQEKDLLLALYKQRVEMLGGHIERDAQTLDMIVSLRAAAQQQKNRADALERALQEKEDVIEELTQELTELRVAIKVLGGGKEKKKN